MMIVKMMTWSSKICKETETNRNMVTPPGGLALTNHY